MGTQPFQVTPIESYMPTVDARNDISNSRRVQQPTVVLDGKNYVFDVLGPKSGFAVNRLSHFPLQEPRDVQSIDIAGRTYVFTGDAILMWNQKLPFTWVVLHTFDTLIPQHMRDPWAAMYVNGKIYFSQKFRGLFESEVDPYDVKLRLLNKTDVDIPGVIKGIQAMDIVRSRPILVNGDTIQWGGVDDMSDLTPGLGGPGFQLISAFIKGKFMALVSFDDGFTVWTDQGSVTAEYIGGDSTWRFFVNATEEHPISRWCVQRLSSGEVAFMSPRGLMIADARAKSKPWTQEFNEYLREIVIRETGKTALWRLEYDSSREWLFLSESANGNTFWRTFVLTVPLNKWGVLSEELAGLMQLTADEYGYVDSFGCVKYFSDNKHREIEPDNNEGLNRHKPRIQKQGAVLSSTAVCNARGWATAIPSDPQPIQIDGWYEPVSTLPVAAFLGPLDSSITVGYLRPQQSSKSVDGLLELQEIVIGTQARRAPIPADYTSQWNADFFYTDSEDWEAGTGVEDWGSMTGTEDWDGATTSLPYDTFQMSLESSDDGITFASVTPVMAKFNLTTSLYTMRTSGIFHRLKVSAETTNDYFHLTFIGVTMVYGGEII